MTDLPLLSQVLSLDCSNIHWITPVYGFLGSTINKSINQSILLEKLTGSHLVKKFPAFYGTRRFITAFTSAHGPPLLVVMTGHLRHCLTLPTQLPFVGCSDVEVAIAYLNISLISQHSLWGL